MTGDIDQHPWQRLSLRTLVLHLPTDAFQIIPGLLAVTVVGGVSSSIILPASLVGIAALSIARWVTTTYRITPERIELRRGIISRRALSVPRDRVRTVDLTADIMHRLLDLERMTIGTGATKADDNLTLDALVRRDAEGLRAQLLHRDGLSRPVILDPAEGSPGQSPLAPGVETTLSSLEPSWVRFAPFTLAGSVTFAALTAGVMSALDDLRFDFWNAQVLREAERTVLASEASLVVFVVVAGLLGLVVISMIAYVVSFSGYRLTRHSHGTLHVSRGLFTTRQVTIEQRRLHGVTVSESLLLRFVKGGKLSAIATGLGAGDEDDGGAMLVPPAPISEVRRVGALVAGNEEAVTGPLEAHGPAARRRRIARALSSAVVAAAAALLLWMYGEISLVLALVTIAALGVAGLALGVDRYRNLGSAVKDGRFIVSRGSLLRRRDVVADDGVIGWVVQASFFQRRAGLVTLNAATAAGSQHYGALDVPAARALALVAATNPGLLDPFVRGVGVPQQPS